MSTTKILKFPVRGNGVVTTINCRKKRILDIQLQERDMVCWIETDDDISETETELISLGTGWEIPSGFLENAKYVKTVQDCAGYVWHFYELLR